MLDGATLCHLLRYGLSKRVNLSFEFRKLATHISQCLGRSSVVPLVSQSRYSISRLFFRSFVEPAQREMDASDYRCSIPAEKEQEARSKRLLCSLYRTVATLYSKLSVTF